MRMYETNQIKNRDTLREHYNAVYRKIPSYKDLEDMASSVSIAHTAKIISGDTDALAELSSILADIHQQKETLLKTYGFPADYLNPIFTCADCNDTGYILGEKCHCFKQAIIKELYVKSNIQEMLEKCTFSALSDIYYEGEDKERFRSNVNISHKFIEKFNAPYQNLFFYGTVGTGKSNLSGCIAKELIDKGYSVIYFSSQSLFDELSKYAFDFKNKESFCALQNDLYACDLLIIDDLGTEVSSKFVSSQLFTIINERHLREKSTIISTNLSLEDILLSYSERIFSRITANYSILKFSGPDIRMLQKKTKKESEAFS